MDGAPLILIVEDDDAMREVIADVLGDRGYRVMLAANGAEALDTLDRERPDAMVLDLLMPVMHGWAFMESYADRTGGDPIPIVVASVNAALPRSFTRFGVKEVVCKPFDVDAFVSAVETALASQSRVPV